MQIVKKKLNYSELERLSKNVRYDEILTSDVLENYDWDGKITSYLVSNITPELLYKYPDKNWD